MEVGLLSLDAIAEAPLPNAACGFLMVPAVLSAVDLATVRADFPQIAGPGIFSLSELIYGPAFAELIREVCAKDFQTVIERKSGIDLSDKSMVIFVCGQGHRCDCETWINHNDGVVTCLLYLNNIWDDRSGGLCIVPRNNDPSGDIADVPTGAGALNPPSRTDRSWHGAAAHAGEQRVVMLNWVATQAACEGVWAATGSRGHG